VLKTDLKARRAAPRPGLPKVQAIITAGEAKRISKMFTTARRRLAMARHDDAQPTRRRVPAAPDHRLDAYM
jgi:hypothetical protein